MTGALKLGPWTLNHVHNMDALGGLEQLPADCLDLVVTSPPCWDQVPRGKLGLTPDGYVRDLVRILVEALRCLKPSGTLWLSLADTHDARGNWLMIPYRIVLALGDLGYLFRGEVIWKKPPARESPRVRLQSGHGGIYIFAKSEQHVFQKKPPVGSVWELVQPPDDTSSGVTFPLDLPTRCIHAAAVPRGGIICDPFMGNGVTAAAALMSGRTYIGFESDRWLCACANDLPGNALGKRVG